MKLGGLIKLLESLNPKETLPVGLSNPHSYRGYYDDLAFEPIKKESKVSDILKVVRDCVGQTFTGYKGGDFTMDESSTIWIAHYSCTADKDESPSTEDILSYFGKSSDAVSISILTEVVESFYSQKPKVKIAVAHAVKLNKAVKYLKSKGVKLPMTDAAAETVILVDVKRGL